MAKKKKKRKTARSKAKDSKDLVGKELTEEEKVRMAHYQERSERKPLKFKSLKSDSRNPTIALKDPDDPLVAVKMLEALGTPDFDVQSHLLDQVIHTFKGTVSTDGADYDKVATAANNAMAILSGIHPQDEIEGMLAIQMISAHNLAMDSLRRAVLDGQTFEGRKANTAHATKMLKTFMMQMETLKRYRADVQQKMVVGSVSVSEGGQAIVGTVEQRIDKRGVQE
ncbi:MAG: hypothetical protein ACFFCW_08520 [Candidatus Hodarchaeota archaeon]